jgi:nucleotide-binding universal stress UspA family protein
MGYKTILVHCDASKSTSSRLRVALDLADRFDGHVIGLHVRQRFEAPMFSDATIALDVLYKTYETAVKADEAASLAAFKAAVGTKGYSNEWRSADGYAEDVVVAQARTADVVVLSQRDPDSGPMATPPDLAEKVALASERPVLIVPHIGVAKPPGGKVMVCWNGRREAARAATGALPLLKKASSVTLLIIDPEKSDAGSAEEPGVEAAEWLTRHGAKVTVQRDTAADSDIGNVILSRAADQDADLIVMGIYGHSRMREMVLGGASRTVLSSMTVPLLVAH